MKEIPLTKGKVAIVDDEDYQELSKNKWMFSTSNYASRRVGKKTTMLMHRYIMDAKPAEFVDHINGNTLDNRRQNLRIVTKSQNCFNQGIRNDNTSGYKGVTFYKRHNKYASRIFKGDKAYFLGYFDDPKDAARMYNFWALDLFGEYARLNVINEEETK